MRVLLKTLIKTLIALPVAVGLWAASSLAAGAQTLTHRYSMNGNANDSVGGVNGFVTGRVTFTTSPGVNGVATFPGGNPTGTPTPASYIRLPNVTVNGLQDATVEIFVTKFSGGMPYIGDANGFYQALFDVSSSYNLGKYQTNYVILTVNRDRANLIGAGIGVAGRINNGPETVISSGFDLPKTGGLVTLVYQGFKKVGDMGTVTIYLNGDLVARGGTFFSFADVAAAKDGVGAVGINTVGIGGGSPYPDPTFNGSITEARIWSGALSPAQVMADFKAGPAVVAATSPTGATPPTTPATPVR